MKFAHFLLVSAKNTCFLTLICFWCNKQFQTNKKCSEYNNNHSLTIVGLGEGQNAVIDEKSMSQKWKIQKNVVTYFFEFIGFMVCQTSVSISRLTSFLRFGKRCFLARDIHKNVKWKNMKKLKDLEISLARKHRFPNRKKLVNREIETVVLNTINPMNSKK